MTELEQLREAAQHADWQQVVLNQGPPCFHYQPETKTFCLRAARWDGHRVLHFFVPLVELIERVAAGATANALAVKSR